jgi:hypothetical protein
MAKFRFDLDQSIPDAHGDLLASAFSGRASHHAVYAPGPAS